MMLRQALNYIIKFEYNKNIELEKINNILPALIKKYNKESQNKKIILIKNSLLNVLKENIGY